MFVDGVGNVYVTGSSSRSVMDQNRDYVTIKYNSAGQMQWLLRYNGPQNGNDFTSALAVDGSGNVYVTGTSYSFGKPDIVTIKYSQSLSGADEQKPAGVHVVNFAPKNLPSGIYFYALTAGEVRLVRRMVYAK
jgi:hypothetical protein